MSPKRPEWPDLIPKKFYYAYFKGKPGHYASSTNPHGYHLVRFRKRYGSLASVRLFDPYTNLWTIKKRIPMSAFGTDPQPVKARRRKRRQETP